MFWSYFEWRHPLPRPSVLTWTKCPPFCESPAVTGPELIRNPVSWPKSLPKPQTRLPPNIALNSKNLSFSKSGLSPQEKPRQIEHFTCCCQWFWQGVPWHPPSPKHSCQQELEGPQRNIEVVFLPVPSSELVRDSGRRSHPWLNWRTIPRTSHLPCYGETLLLIFGKMVCNSTDRAMHGSS